MVDINDLLDGLGDGDASTPEPEPAPDVQPVEDIDAKLEAFRNEFASQYAARESEYQKTIREQQAKLSQLEGLVQGAYAAAHPQAPANTEPVYTDEDFIRDPKGTVERVSQLRAKKAVDELTQQLSPLMNNMIERGYRGEMAGLSTKKYFGYVKDEIEQTFTNNPALKAQPGAVEHAYNLLVGRDIEKLEERYRKDHPVQQSADPVAQAIGVPKVTAGKPGSAGPPSPPRKEIELTPAQQAMLERFQAMNPGVKFSPEDFVEA